MNADEYQEWTRTTAVYPEADEGTITALSYVIMAYGGEVGEIQNKFKKVLRGDDNMIADEFDQLSDTAKHRILEELIGSAYYFARVADELRVPLSFIFQESHDLLEGRKERGTIQGDGDER